MQDTIVVSSKRKAYIILAEVEFLQEGHAAQHREQAAEEQQQARLPSDITPPMMVS